MATNKGHNVFTDVMCLLELMPGSACTLRILWILTIQSVLCCFINLEDIFSQIKGSHFSMFVKTKATFKYTNGNTGHAQVIENILYCFPNCPIIYPVVPV